ncbi:translation factor SUA5 [Actinobaculum suis]|uniref:L-threonylcarbamoyladenylate synthase n=1 Tax=Actinobaculum suis TaxID=1657 RepID=A0A7Z8YBG2_9ACTO|nr:L-threonylcarbamoyladenylate synthase [Actinobaculum suis]VDG77061.1 translation factor SUA5 [Actinobaculum suis]
MQIFEVCESKVSREAGSISPAFAAARAAVAAGELIVLPTDTVYGIGCDPLNREAVTRLLTAKGRGRDKPSPVLISSLDDARRLTVGIPPVAEQLAAEFWPGALTIVLPARPEIGWDLGETGGTVALRMPDNEIALELLRECGPLAVTSANLTGQPPARTAAEAQAQLGEKVAVYLDGGSVRGGVPSTIVRVNTSRPAAGAPQLEILRHGAIADAEIGRFGSLAAPAQ